MQRGIRTFLTAVILLVLAATAARVTLRSWRNTPDSPLPQPPVANLTPAPDPAPPLPAVGKSAHLPSSSNPDANRFAQAGTTTAAATPPWNLGDPQERHRIADRLRNEQEQDQRKAWNTSLRAGRPPRVEGDGGTRELVAIRNGRVYQRRSFNARAALTTDTTPVLAPPYSLDGNGVAVGLWDEGAVRVTHRELQGRIMIKDNVSSAMHSTHLAGTIGALGIDTDARGMAPACTIDSYDWNNDHSEMVARGMATAGETNTLQISNHSYGFDAGWSGDSWYGTWGARESDNFGLYDHYCTLLDATCEGAPYYLPFVAAGNDRNDYAPGAGQTFSYFDGTDWKTKNYDPDRDPLGDGAANGGYDTIPLDANAKNVVTVGAIEDAVDGGRRSLAFAIMSSFSGWGPSDDGRIKPDLVANGVNLYSCNNPGDASYTTLSGTSMSVPNAVGSTALLVQLFNRECHGRFMRACMLKGLLLHTADDLGNAGPDYQFGWGLLNTRSAADHILAYASRTNVLRMVEDRVSNPNKTNTYDFVWNNAGPIRITLCWTDPPGSERSRLDDRRAQLVHDLNVRLFSPSGKKFFPYVLDVENPNLPANTGDNRTDNVEQIRLENPGESGRYRVSVSLDGVFATNRHEQIYALLVSGATLPPKILHTAPENTTNTVGPYRLEIEVDSEMSLRADSLQILWNTTGSLTDFQTNTLVELSAGHYAAQIPGQPRGTRLSYYFSVSTESGLTAVLPALAPAALLSFSVTPPVSLTVTGTPAEVGAVTPPYGTTILAAGVTLRATAPAFVAVQNDFGYGCSGWTLDGPVPQLSGTRNTAEFTIAGDSRLAWHWTPAFTLSQSTPVNGTATSIWHLAGTSATTFRADEQIQIQQSNLRFVRWEIDGQRWPDTQSEAQNPAFGILMNTSRVAVAVYLPADLDADGDLLPDWWEHFYFASTALPPNVDSDDDGFTNVKEYRDRSNPRDSQSTPIPPSIAHTPLPAVLQVPAAWPVTATVTDDSGVDTVVIEWRRNNGVWQSAPLSTAGNHAYTGAIPAPGLTGDTFAYRITARDQAGLTAVNGPYTITVRYPLIHFTPSHFNDFVLPESSTLRSEVAISNAGHRVLEWNLQLLQSGLQEDVEGEAPGWSHEGSNDVWHISAARPYAGLYCWYFGEPAARSYPSRANAALISPNIYLAQPMALTFWHWLNTETPKNTTQAWDGAFVEISTNNGLSYTQITPEGGYPYTIYKHDAAPFPGGTPCFSGVQTWKQVRFNLSAYAGQMARLRFRFGSDGYVQNEGWFIDNIEVTPYAGTLPWISISPTNGTVAADASGSLQFTLNSTGLAPDEARHALLNFTSNDPLTPLVRIPIVLRSGVRSVTVSVLGHGNVTPGGTIHLQTGGSATFEIVPDPYYHLAYVLTNGALVKGLSGPGISRLTWQGITSASTLQAQFAENLAAYGVSEWWLAAHGLTNRDFNAETILDPDADSMLTWQEFVAGTDPTNRLSRLSLTRLERSGSTYRSETYMYTNEQGQLVTIHTQILARTGIAILQWQSVQGRVYHLHRSTNLTSGFGSLDTPIAATPPTNTFQDQVEGSGRQFYRLDVQRPKP